MGSLQEASTCRGEWLLPSLTRVFFPTGHFAKDCFMQPGGTKYSLIPEEEEEKEEAKAEGLEKPDPTKNSSRKRKKVRAALLLWVTVW